MNSRLMKLNDHNQTKPYIMHLKSTISACCTSTGMYQSCLLMLHLQTFVCCCAMSNTMQTKRNHYCIDTLVVTSLTELRNTESDVRLVEARGALCVGLPGEDPAAIASRRACAQENAQAASPIMKV